jgi:hypothetical protein
MPVPEPVAAGGAPSEPVMHRDVVGIPERFGSQRVSRFYKTAIVPFHIVNSSFCGIAKQSPGGTK